MEIMKNIETEITELHRRIAKENWFDFTKMRFLREAKNAEDRLGEIKEMMEKLKEKVEFQTGFDIEETNATLTNIGKIQNILLNNLRLESEKTSNDSVSEIYSDLQNRVLLVLLQGKHFLEKAKIQVYDKEELPKDSKAIMESLHKKNREIGELKERYENLRKKSYFGIIPEETYIDLGEQLEENRVLMENALEAYIRESSVVREQMDSFLKHMQEKEKEFEKIREHLREYLKKTNEYSKQLKKERDFAQKTALDIEAEGSGIRTHYLDSLLNIEKEKHLHRQDLEQQLENKYEKIASENRELRDLTNRLREINSSYDRKIKLLEEENKELKVLLETAKKHKSLQARFYEKEE